MEAYKVIWMCGKFIIMRDMFNKHNVFIKKIQLWKCSLCPLGVSIFSNAQRLPKLMVLAPTTAGMETTAEPDVVVECANSSISSASNNRKRTSSVSTVQQYRGTINGSSSQKILIVKQQLVQKQFLEAASQTSSGRLSSCELLS